MPRAAWGLALLLAVTGVVRPVMAQPAPVAPTGGPPSSMAETEHLGTPPPEPAAAPSTPARSGTLPSILGAPVRAADQSPEPGENVRAAGVNRGESPVPKESADSLHGNPGRLGEDNSGRVQRVGALGAPIDAGGAIPARAIEPARVTNPQPPPDPVNDFLGKRSTLRDSDRDEREKTSQKFGERLHGLLGHTDSWFKSDHVFDGFISPVTNPFLFEDPRSLTEIRPIFMYQQIPGRQPDLHGGNIWWFGTQARVAFTDRLSFVFHKLGGISVNPGSASVFDGQTGFSELWLGPKYTFIRNEEAGRVMAGGLQFQVPVGSKGTFQDTGSLSLVPYLSYAENFGRDWRVGSINAMLGTGYSVSVNRLRSDYYYLSGHLDLDVGNCHRFYPLTELNWLIYTSNGTSIPIGSEGRDLINFGSQAKGNGMITWAIGARYKISESAQIGGAFELPIAGPRDIFRYRFTLDFILRY
jgi:hypothetical protein